MEQYKVTIEEASKALTGKEKIQLKDTTDCEHFDELTEAGPVIIDLDFWAVLGIHNDFAQNDKDYKNYIIVDKDGTRYSTGSSSFWDHFKSLYDDMKDEQEPWKLKVFRKASKKRAGKSFITCSII